MTITRRKHILIVLFAVTALLSGVVAQYFEPGVAFGRVNVGSTLVATLLIFLWFHFDANQLGYARSKWLNIAVIALALLALPYYFFRSRPLKLAAVATLIFVLAMAASVFISWLGAIAVYVLVQS